MQCKIIVLISSKKIRILTEFFLFYSESSEAVRVRHCGVLGLCAFISAYPYDIPDFVPNVFEIISNHLNDPQPIPVIINTIP